MHDPCFAGGLLTVALSGADGYGGT